MKNEGAPLRCVLLWPLIPAMAVLWVVAFAGFGLWLYWRWLNGEDV